MKEFELHHQEPRERVCYITVSGWLSASGVGEFERQLLPLMRDERYDECIIDCLKVEYISSAGLRVFMKAMQIWKKLGKPQIICRTKPNSMLHSSLTMVGLAQYLSIRT